MEIFANGFNEMVRIPLTYNFILFSTSNIFLTMFFCFFDSVSSELLYNFLKIFSLRRLSFSFPLPLLFPFLFFVSFPFCPLFPFFFSFFFLLFSKFASFPQFGLPFPKSAAPVLPHFLLPCPIVLWKKANDNHSHMCKRIFRFELKLGLSSY